ncbi:hypothetical protein [Moorella sp. Hama-1]|uniref:hypothetical protein n=1 Tax=Moorella sp. Hama-1 TaxID=2138101 RepID=UPI000D65A424|nr:hypothetical protein [Moorella sp. Hama-1]BCV22921.1 hypothetical protein hamaS1_29900 [Moorella sp. Hama-1]
MATIHFMVAECGFNSPLAGQCYLNFQEFPFSTGVVVEKDLRVRGFTNLLACGRILGGHNPYSEGCGNGVALATAWMAGATIKGEAVG